MFATLLGGLPRPPLAASASAEAILDAVVAAEVDAGLDLITDGGWPLDPDDPVASWSATSQRTDRPVKAAVAGPFSAGLATGADLEARRATIRALADAGCPFVEVREPAAVGIGADELARSRFRDLTERLLDDLPETHVSLAITGGSADGAGRDTILRPPFASLAVDLIEGADNWRLITAAPPERGIVCGAVAAQAGRDDGPEILLWAAGHASAGRGLDRVGLATASSLAHLSWSEAIAKMARLGEAARLAVLPPEERLAGIDPRAVDSRSAAMGRYTPRPRRPPPA